MAKPKELDGATREAIREEAAAGLSITQIAEKHGVSWYVAKKCAGGAAPAKKGKSKHAVSSNGAGLKATPAMCDALWSALPIEKKINFLNFIYQAS